MRTSYAFACKAFAEIGIAGTPDKAACVPVDGVGGHRGDKIAKREQ
jgi:hypothetical protein